MKEQFLNLTGLTELVGYLKTSIANHKEILPYASNKLFPSVGDINTIYINTATNTIYRWDSSSKTYITLAKAVKSVAISESTENGKITLTVDGNKTTVPVHGLGSAAYTNSSAYSSAGHTHTKAQVGLGNVDNTADANKSVKHATTADSATTAGTATNVSAGEGTADAARHVWFSDSTTETKRAYSDKFKYNPVTNNLTVNVTGNAATASSVAWGNITEKPSTYAPSAHNHNDSTITSLNASKLFGTIDIARLPHGALERLIIVEDDTARFKLTTANIQLGDTVKVTKTEKMYYVVDESKLSSEAGYSVYTAGTATSVPWSGVTEKPSSYPPASHNHDERYYTETEMNSKLAEKATKVHTHTKSEVGLGNVDNTADATKSVKYAISAGSASSAAALTSNAGSSTQPVYFSGGKPVACSYTLGKSVPADALFTDHTYGNMKGATSSSAGSAGLVPAPNIGEQLKFLRADGAWVIPTNTTYSVGTSSYLGITKLYTETGSATDGTMTQNAITTALNGKSPTSHTHNYAGSSSSGGAANSANKLATARTVSGGTDITLSFNYDGSGNSSANIGFYSSSASVGDKNNYPFHRFAKLDTIAASYSDRSTTFFISQDYSGGGFGIVRIVLRTNNSSLASTVEVKWLVRCGLSEDSVQVGIYNVFGKTYADAFFKTGGSYAGTCFRTLASGARGGISRTWVLVNSSEVSGTSATDAKTSTECYATIAAAGTALHKQAYSSIVSGTDSGTASYANSAGSANSVAWGNVTGKPSTFAPSSHTHNYAGSSSSGGAANSANKLATARTVSGGTDITLSFNYDGSGNSSANIGFYSSSASVGDKNNYPFHRFAKLDTIAASYSDRSTTFFISQDYSGGGFGIVRIVLRTNNSSLASTVEVKWLVRCGLSEDSVQVGIYNVFGKTYADAFFKTGGSYAGTCFRTLASGARGGISRTWVLVNSSEVSGTSATDAKTSTECYATIAAAGTALHKQAYSSIVSGTDSGTASYANSAGSANSVAWGNVTGKPSTFAPSSHTHNYAGSSSAGGAATSANKLSTPRKIGNASFDGTADITLSQMGLNVPVEITKANYLAKKKAGTLNANTYYNVIDEYDSANVINDSSVTANSAFSSTKSEKTYAKKSTLVNTTLTASKWTGSSAPYSYVLSVSGVTSSNIVEIDYASNASSAAIEAYQNAMLADGGQTTNQITIKATEKPTVDIPITIVIRNDL
ncbi:hypothetical protein [Eubacterium ventriosum]|uniref:hypothetical protein n=1 Tax=Eubacterium ventriosum TaxID=39496 RepID=UPI0039969EE6